MANNDLIIDYNADMSPTEETAEVIDYDSDVKLPPRKRIEKPVIGFDGVASDFETVEEPYSADVVLKSKYGDNFDDSKWFGDGILDTWNMGVLGKFDTNEGRIRKFKEWYPEGDVRFVSAEGEEYSLARKGPGEPYRKISGWQTVPGDALVNVPTAAGIAAAPFTSGMSVLPAIGTEVAISAFGGMLDEKIMQAVEPERNSNAFMVGAGEGGAQAAASFIFRGGPLGVLFKSISDSKPSPGALKALESGKEEGLVPLTKGQFSSNPATKSLYQQYIGYSEEGLKEALKAYESLGEDGLLAYVQKNGFKGVQRKVIQKLLEREATKIDSTVSAIRKGGVSFSEGSEALNKTFDLFFELAGAEEKALYAKARTLADDAEFDLEEVRDMAFDFSEGTVARGVTSPLSTVPESVPINPAKGELKDLVDTILKMDPLVSKYAPSGKPVQESLDQMLKLRSRVRALKDSTTDKDVQSKANKLYKGLTKSLTNPKGGDPDFVDAWLTANETYAKNRSVEELKTVVNLRRADPHSYAAYSRQLITPKNADTLLFLEGLVKKTDPAAWDTMRASFIDHIVQNPTQGVKLLDSYYDSFRTDALRSLVSEADEKTIREFMQAKDALESSPLWKAQERMDLDLANKAFELVNSGNVDDLAKTVALAGGKRSPTVRSMKAGIVQKWYQEAAIPNEYGEPIIDSIKFRQLVETAKNSKKLDVLFSPADFKWLENMENYAVKLGAAPLSKEGVSTGAELQLGAQAGTVARAPVAYAEKGLKGIWQAFRLPVSMPITARLMGLNKRVSTAPKGFNSTTKNAISLMKETALRAPIMMIEAQDALEYEMESGDISAPYMGGM